MTDVIKKIQNLERNVNRCMCRDRFGFIRSISGLKNSLSANPNTEPDEAFLNRITALEQRFAQSMAVKDRRARLRPRLRYNEDLPITQRKDEIIDCIRKNQVIILSGETGSGKTTQLPKFCLAAGRGLSGMIACTQPRRIAALTVSARIAEELDDELGNSVGYQIRFQEKVSENTLIKVMTDGVLLAEVQKDRYLNAYDTIIVDEAHERSLNIDFILGILRDLLKKRKDLKVIVTSATIDTQKFSKAFDGAPVIDVSGRSFPVETFYRPPAEDDDEDNFVDRAVAMVEEINRMGPWGDILIFMPTEADIKECCDLLKARSWLNATVLPLFARLSASDQKAVFAPVTGRKIVVATNVAETSITIPGIRYVIDTGLARIPRYTPRTRTTSLPVMAVSKSSADQRKGRAGRVENGYCYRLYSEESYENRPLFTAPQILRANLAEVILRMISLRLGDVEQFPFIDPPSSKSVRDGFDTLVELGAIKPSPASDKKDKLSYTLTENGKIMARIPVDPTLSRMLIEAEKRCCLADVTIIIAALSIPDPRERPLDKAQQADQAHAKFKDPLSDFVTLLNIWNAFHKELNGSRKAALVKAFCKTHFLSFLRMREWMDIHGQLSDTLREFGLDGTAKSSAPSDMSRKTGPFSEKYAAIHQSILAGYLSGIALKKEKNLYLATRGREAMIFPGSGLFNNGGPWIVASEVVETSRLFARNVANIDKSWLEELGGASVCYSYSDPHWSKAKGAVFVNEQVSLFGLVIDQRTVLYGRINPADATRIFIRSALVDGEVDLEKAGKDLAFLTHNLAMADQVRSLEDRFRKRDLMVADEEVEAFYAEKIKDISDIRSLIRFVRTKGGGDFLKMPKTLLHRYEPDKTELARFPEKLTLGESAFGLSYKFDPGNEEDGITVSIPAGKAAGVSPESLDWLVPGLVKEKIESLIKNLPKEYRKRLVPITSTVAVIDADMPELKTAKEKCGMSNASLITALSRFIKRRFNVDIPAAAWSTTGMSPHLSMRISIVGTKGDVLAQGRDPGLLLKDFTIMTDDDGFDAARKSHEKIGITSWDFGDLPDSIPLFVDNKEKGIAFPGLRIEDGKIALRLFRAPRKAEDSHREGVKSLFELRLADHLKSLRKDVVLKGNHRNYANYFGGEKKFNQNMADRVIEELFSVNIRSQKEFEAHAAKTAPLIHRTGQDILALSTTILTAFHEARTLIYARELKETAGGLVEGLALELREELANIAPESFLSLYSLNRLKHLERFIKGIKIRAARGFENPEKDRAKTVEIKPFADLLSGFVTKLGPKDSQEKRDKIEEFFWLIEEYKVSVFAQELKTQVKVSAKRLRELADEIRLMV